MNHRNDTSGIRCDSLGNGAENNRTLDVNGFPLSQLRLIFPDPVCGRPRVRHRPGEDFQVLLPEAQDEGHQLLPRGRVHSADRMAHRRRGARVLRLFPPVQVKVLTLILRAGDLEILINHMSR